MADRIIKILTPATEFDFLTLDECKTLLGIATTTPEEDAQLQMMISVQSAIIAEYCNRTFAYEEVQETWRSDLTISANRIFLSHWPVKQADLTIVAAPRGTVLDPASDYELEEISGKVEMITGMSEPIDVTYSGGYKLPDDAPLALKQAAIMLIRQERMMMLQAQTAGIRSISHRDARVMFFDPNTLLAKTMGKGAQMPQTVQTLLSQFTRIEA